MELEGQQFLHDGVANEKKRTQPLRGLAAHMNLGSAIFNLMNAVIGAGIISLGYAASVLGTVQFLVWIGIVVAISAFTMDLVVALSKYTGCYVDLTSAKVQDPNSNAPIVVCPRDQECPHRRIYSYEKIGEILFGGWIKLFINFIILFYLAIALTTYFIIIKDNLPGIVIGTSEILGYDHLVDKWYTNGKFLLGLMLICVQLPLGFLKRIDFLGFTSFIGMACMLSFVVLVVMKQPAASALCGQINYTDPLPTPMCHTEYFHLSINSVYALPMMLFSFMCHGNILSIVAGVKPAVSCKSKYPSQRRLRQMIAGTTIPTTILYIITALEAYNSYYNRTESMLLKMYRLWLNGDIMLLLSKILVTLCITFSVPILHYPCRYSLWNLCHQFFPNIVPPAYDNGYPLTWNRFWYYFFALLIQGGLYALVCITDNFKIVLSLGGAIAGSCIIQIFPAMFYLKIHNWRMDSTYDKTIWAVMVLGVVTFFSNTSIIIVKNLVGIHGHVEKDYPGLYSADPGDLFNFIYGRMANGTLNSTAYANVTAMPPITTLYNSTF